MIELQTLGALELTSADGTPLGSVLAQPRRIALVCYLALASPRGFQRRDSLYALFWPEHRAEQARHALRQSLYFLRRALGPDAIISRGDDELALAPDRIRCDAAEFERMADEGRLEPALALYRGDLLAGFHISDAPEFERWLDEERTRLRRRAAEAAWALADAREGDGDPARAAEWGRRAAALSPADETVLRRLVLLLDRVGDRAAAMRAYEAFARDLEQEYELEPSAETRDLVARLRAERERSVEAAPEARPQPQRTDVAGHPRAAEPIAGFPADLQPSQLLGERETRAGPVVTAPPRSSAPAARRPRNRPGAWLALGALLAFLGAGTWRLMAGAGPEPAPSVRERVVVADFTNPASDSTFGDLVAHILRSELARSPALSVLGRVTIADALRRMRRQPGTRLTADVAREVAARQEIKLVVEGDVRAAGTGLVISASVIETATGDVIHGASEAARDSTQILPAIERLSNGIRQGIGESLASIRATGRLPSFTTSSLAALRKQMAAIDARGRGDYLRAVELLEEAIALDSAFTHAYLSLAGQLEAAGLPLGRVVPTLVRAYDARELLTERERYAAEAYYHLNVTGDLPKAVSAFRKHLETPQCVSNEPCWVSSFGAALALSGDLAAAEKFLGEAPYAYSILGQLVRVRALYGLGRDAEARGALEELLRRAPEHPSALRLQVDLLADSGRYEEAHALAGRIRRSSGLRNDLLAQAEVDAMRGRLAEAVEHLRDLRDQALAIGEPAPALEIAAAAGRLRILSGDSAGASEVDDLLARHRVDSLDVLSRPYLRLALFYAEAGRPRRTRAWLDAYERELPPRFRGPDRWMLHRARAAAHRAEGNLVPALAELRLAAREPPLRVGLFDEPSMRMGNHPELARVYDELGSADSAIAVYERYLAVRSLSRTSTDAFELGNALERLGALHEERGDRVRAAAYYRRLANLWRGADAALRPRVESARRRADSLDLASARAPLTPPPPRSSP